MPYDYLASKMRVMRLLAAAQSSPEWLGRHPLRPKDKPLSLVNPNLKYLHAEGVIDFESGVAWLRRWIAYGQQDIPNLFVTGSRDMCWHVSWLLEVLEGRFEGDVANNCSPDCYLKSRYGVLLYDAMWNDQ